MPEDAIRPDPLSSDQIRLEVIRVANLAQFSEEFFRHPEGQVMSPIGRTRALAQPRNPFAEPEDPGLIVAYCGKKVVGCYGVVPSRLVTAAGHSKVLTGSAIYVLPEYRNHMIGIMFARQIASFGYDVMLTGVNETVFRVFRALGFIESTPLEIVGINVGKLHVVEAVRWKLDRRRAIPPRLSRLALAASAVARPLTYVPLRAAYAAVLERQALRKLRGVDYRQVQELGPGPAEEEPAAPHFARGRTGVNWMLRMPWLQARGAAPEEVPPYYFSDFRDRFQQFAFEWTGGYVVFNVQENLRHRSLKVTDFAARADADVAAAFWVTALHAARHRVDSFECVARFRPYLERTPLARFLAGTTHRKYLLFPVEGGSLGAVMAQLEPQYADADCAFS